jgi:hypothetical protein
MDHDDLLRMLRALQQERADAEHQLAGLQRRVEALRKTADGLEELIGSIVSVTKVSVTKDDGQPAVTETAETGRSDSQPPKTTAPGIQQSLTPQGRVAPPKGSSAALAVLKSAPERFWTVREVWDEQVKQGWAGGTKDSRAAVRVALVRLARRDPHVDRIDSPVSAYRWSSDLSSSNGASSSVPFTSAEEDV